MPALNRTGKAQYLNFPLIKGNQRFYISYWQQLLMNANSIVYTTTNLYINFLLPIIDAPDSYSLTTSCCNYPYH